jgi:hypothetical protein
MDVSHSHALRMCHAYIHEMEQGANRGDDLQGKLNTAALVSIPFLRVRICYRLFYKQPPKVLTL